VAHGLQKKPLDFGGNPNYMYVTLVLR